MRMNKGPPESGDPLIRRHKTAAGSPNPDLTLRKRGTRPVPRDGEDRQRDPAVIPGTDSEHYLIDLVPVYGDGEGDSESPVIEEFILNTVAVGGNRQA